MRWVLVDVVVVLVALVLFAGLALGLWRRVKALGRDVTTAGDQVGRVTDALATISDGRPPAPPLRPAAGRARGVGSGRPS